MVSCLFTCLYFCSRSVVYGGDEYMIKVGFHESHSLSPSLRFSGRSYVLGRLFPQTHVYWFLKIPYSFGHLKRHREITEGHWLGKEDGGGMITGGEAKILVWVNSTHTCIRFDEGAFLFFLLCVLVLGVSTSIPDTGDFHIIPEVSASLCSNTGPWGLYMPLLGQWVAASSPG